MEDIVPPAAFVVVVDVFVADEDVVVAAVFEEDAGADVDAAFDEQPDITRVKDAINPITRQ
jgi:hypothetical protein